MKRSSRDYVVITRWSEAEQVYRASVAELPGSMADGPTRMETARLMKEALEFALAATEQLGYPLPAPSRLCRAV